MAEIGNTLREARIRRGLTIKDIEAVTRIRSRYLEALEQDDFAVIPGPTYVCAFLRTYAGHLKLDAEELVDEYKRHHEPRRVDEPGTLRVEPSPHSRTRGAMERKRKARRTQRGYIFVGILAVIIVVLLAWLGTNWHKQGAAAIGTESIPPQGSTTSLVSVSSTTTVPAAGGNTTTSSAVKSDQNVELVLEVKKGSCWLVVHENSKDGPELYAGTLAAGGQKTFNSAKRYWMNVGQPELLAVSINGQPASLGTTAGVFLVTGAGIQASQ